MAQNIFKNPYVSSAPTLTGGSVGNGTLTIDKLTHFTINQSYTAVCTSIDPFTVFNIIGSLDGAVGVAVVGTQFSDEDLKVFLTINQGPVLFQPGDTFQFTLAQGTDVTQGNIDEYDELPQKNFGAGQTGTNTGDHNLRFSSNPELAEKKIGDLLFKSTISGPLGNDISVEYIAGSHLAAAFRTIQDIKYEANIPGIVGNDIQIQYEQFTPGIKASRTIQHLSYQADNAGLAGNLISITYTSGATAGNEIVSVVGNAITVQIQSGVSTADQIRLAIGLHPVAPTMVDVLATGTGSEPQVTQSQTFLQGGTDPVGNAGSEIVTVIGNLIKIKMESGVSTAQQIFDKILLSGAALAKITPTITGVANTAQLAPVGPDNLQNGTEDVGIPGSEVVQVTGQQVKVTFVNGESTATQIRTAILNNIAAAALLTVTLTGTGSELQVSPVARTFLAGGRDGGTYAFNQAELTDPTNFYEGNAPILVTDITNQGDEVTFGETLKKGKVTLDDNALSNISGPVIDNVQKTINANIQNFKAILLSESDLKVEWSKPAGTLVLNGNISLVFTENGVKNTILSTSGPYTLADGEHLYFTVNRLLNTNVTLTKSTSVPTGENIFRLVSRIGTSLFWGDNTCQREGKKIRIGEGGSSGAYQEKLGVGNGSNKNFPILSTLFPIAQEAILVFSNTTNYMNDEWTYNVAQNQIEFVDAPAPGVEVYVWYLTEGDTITIPAPTGTQQVLYRTIDSTENTNKELILPVSPAIPAKVIVDIIGGPPQEFGVDFTVSGSVLSWAGLALDGILTTGDKLRIVYYS